MKEEYLVFFRSQVSFSLGHLKILGGISLSGYTRGPLCYPVSPAQPSPSLFSLTGEV